jgi:hypothetical protein
MIKYRVTSDFYKPCNIDLSFHHDDVQEDENEDEAEAAVEAIAEADPGDRMELSLLSKNPPSKL